MSQLELSVRSSPGGIAGSWARVGSVTGAFLGAVYGGTAGFSIFPVGIPIGAGLGMTAGLAAGLINGGMLAALARPLRLDPGTRPARLRAAAVTVVTTELLLLPGQVLTHPGLYLLWLLMVLAPSVASVAVAAVLGMVLPPSGRPADRDAYVAIS